MVALCGCSAGGTSSWFSKPADFFGAKGGYTYSDLGDAKRDRPVTANDLVDSQWRLSEAGCGCVRAGGRDGG